MNNKALNINDTCTQTHEIVSLFCKDDSINYTNANINQTYCSVCEEGSVPHVMNNKEFVCVKSDYISDAFSVAVTTANTNVAMDKCAEIDETNKANCKRCIDNLYLEDGACVTDCNATRHI